MLNRKCVDNIRNGIFNVFSVVIHDQDFVDLIYDVDNFSTKLSVYVCSSKQIV